MGILEDFRVFGSYFLLLGGFWDSVGQGGPVRVFEARGVVGVAVALSCWARMGELWAVGEWLGGGWEAGVVRRGVFGIVNTEYDRAKVPRYNGDDPRHGTSSNHFHCSALGSSSLGHGDWRSGWGMAPGTVWGMARGTVRGMARGTVRGMARGRFGGWLGGWLSGGCTFPKSQTSTAKAGTDCWEDNRLALAGK